MQNKIFVRVKRREGRKQKEEYSKTSCLRNERQSIATRIILRKKWSFLPLSFWICEWLELIPKWKTRVKWTLCALSRARVLLQLRTESSFQVCCGMKEAFLQNYIHSHRKAHIPWLVDKGVQSSTLCLTWDNFDGPSAAELLQDMWRLCCYCFEVSLLFHLACCIPCRGWPSE